MRGEGGGFGGGGGGFGGGGHPPGEGAGEGAVVEPVGVTAVGAVGPVAQWRRGIPLYWDDSRGRGEGGAGGRRSR